MAHRKKMSVKTDYVGAGPENALIQKSRTFLLLNQTKMTLPEFKILDLYLSRIDSHDSTKRTVKIEKGDLEKALGVSRITKPDLDKRLRNLYQVVDLAAGDSKRIHLVGLFEESEACQDASGLWQINLRCTESAREHIFNLENLGYLKYRLSLVVNLTSRYSYILVLYLLDNRFRKSWRVGIGEIREILQCTDQTYQSFKHLNDKILKRCHAEITEKTNLKFSYRPIKKWRSVEEIEFTVEPESNEIPGQVTFSDVLEEETVLDALRQEEQEEKLTQERLAVYGEPYLVELAELCGFEFDQHEMTVISMILVEETNGFTKQERQTYLAKKYQEFLAVAKKRPIKHRFNYFKKMLQE